jgi:Mg-chelatase subunit ChlI
MKNGLFVSFVLGLLLTGCSKKESVNTDTVQELRPHYDTTAIDSFSDGAISVDIAEQIRKSSVKYQDSVKEALRLQEEEKKLEEELEKENKKKQDEEKKKAEEEKKQQKAAETSAPSTANTQ